MTTSSSSCLEGRSFWQLVANQMWSLLGSYSSSLSLLPSTVHPTDSKSLPNQHLQRLASMLGDGVGNFSSRHGFGLARPMESVRFSGSPVFGEVHRRVRWPKDKNCAQRPALGSTCISPSLRPVKNHNT